MARQQGIREVGMGIELDGHNDTEAARRAVWNAVHQSSLMFLSQLGPNAASEMVVEVTIGIPQPDQVDEATVLAVLPHGKGVLKVVQGGLEIEGREGSGDRTIMANAAVIAKVDMGK